MANLGWQTKIAVGDADPTDTRLNFTRFNMVKNRTVILPQGGDGNLDPLNSRARYGVSTITGQMACEPTAVELAELLPWVFGDTPTGTDYPLGSTFAAKYLNYDAVQDCFIYAGVKVGRAVLEALPNQPMTLTLDLFALTETGGDTFPALTADATTAYFVLTDGVITVNSVTTCTEFFRVTWDMAPTYAPFTNCQTGPASIIHTDRTITVEFLPAYDADHDGLYPPSESGWAVAATFTNGTVSLAFSWPKVVFNQQTPTAATLRDVVKLPLTGRAFRTSGAAAQTCTLDSTP